MDIIKDNMKKLVLCMLISSVTIYGSQSPIIKPIKEIFNDIPWVVSRSVIPSPQPQPPK